MIGTEAWAPTTAGVGSVTSSQQKGASLGDAQTCAFVEATLKCDGAGACSFTTPTLSGQIQQIELAFVDFGNNAQTWTMKSENGATLFTATTTPSSGAQRYTEGVSTGTAGPPIPVCEKLTFAVPTAGANANKSIKVRIYLNPAG